MPFHVKLIVVKGDKLKSFMDLNIASNGLGFRVVARSCVVSQQSLLYDNAPATRSHDFLALIPFVEPLICWVVFMEMLCDLDAL